MATINWHEKVQQSRDEAGLGERYVTKEVAAESVKVLSTREVTTSFGKVTEAEIKYLNQKFFVPLHRSAPKDLEAYDYVIQEAKKDFEAGGRTIAKGTLREVLMASA